MLKYEVTKESEMEEWKGAFYIDNLVNWSKFDEAESLELLSCNAYNKYPLTNY